MKNHNFENKIIESFLEEESAPIAAKTQTKKSSKRKAKIYLTLISLAIGAFGVILVIRGLFLFNPLAFPVSESSYNIGLNKPLGFKSINVDFADFPTSYPRQLSNPQNPEGIYFAATSTTRSIIGFLDYNQKLHKTVWIDGLVKKFIPLNNGNYYLVSIQTPKESFIDLVSFEGINFRLKDLPVNSFIQDLYYDELEDIFMFAYIDELGTYNLQGISTTNKVFDFYKGSLDEGSRIVNYNSNSFFIYANRKCQELNLSNKALNEIDCRIIKMSNQSNVVYTKVSSNDMVVYKYDQNTGQELEIDKLPKDSIVSFQNDVLYSYSKDGLKKLDFNLDKVEKITDKFDNYVFDALFTSGSTYYLKSRITNSIYSYNLDRTPTVPVSYVSYPVSNGLELQRDLDGLNLDLFSDFIVYLPDNIYTL